jgi:hypothetical protein
MDCDVLRCANPIEEVLSVGDSGTGPIDAGVCGEHDAQIKQGARWVYRWGEESGARLLMGQDLPARIVRASAPGGLRCPEGKTRIFTLTVEKPGGHQDDVDFELPPPVSDMIWQILNRDRVGEER